MTDDNKVLSIEVQAAHLVKLAEELGLNLTIEREPLPPLMMGNTRNVITVWSARDPQGVTAVRAMPPRAPGLYDPKDEATLAMDREAYALINAVPLLQSLLYDLNLLPECIGRGDGPRWAYMHAVVSHFRAAWARTPEQGHGQPPGASLTQAPEPSSAGPGSGDRDAYEGARQDLLHWKARAQVAERRLTYVVDDLWFGAAPERVREDCRQALSPDELLAFADARISEKQVATGALVADQAVPLRVETGAAVDVQMWAVNVEGPDDIFAAPDRAIADAVALVLNRQFKRTGENMLNAVVVPWPYGYETWAAEKDSLRLEVVRA